MSKRAASNARTHGGKENEPRGWKQNIYANITELVCEVCHQRAWALNLVKVLPRPSYVAELLAPQFPHRGTPRGAKEGGVHTVGAQQREGFLRGSQPGAE